MYIEQLVSMSNFAMMKLFVCLFVAFTLVSFQIDGAFHDRKLLASKFGGKTKTLPQIHQIRKQIRDQTLANLHGLPQLVKSDLILSADGALKEHYPLKTAIGYMDYFRTGNRGYYEGKLVQHQKRLTTLVVGQTLEEEKNKSSVKYLDEIVNGVWMMMEESTWCMPAHLYLQDNGHSEAHLPTPGQNVIDLNAGEVAKLLGWIKLLLSEQFDHISKVINTRIDFELKKRIFEEFISTDKYGWEGFQGSHEVNNWNIWINANILKSALFTLEDVSLFDRVLNKTIYSADYFLDGYGEDGGCDEGPAYWRQAGGRLIEYLESLDQIFTGAKDYFSTVKLIKSIGEYSYKMLIDKNWFVNFADSVPTNTYPPALLAKFGVLFHDDKMKHFSAYMLTFIDKSSYFRLLLADLNEFCNYVNMHKLIESYEPIAPVADLVWLSDLQVVTARSKVSGDGQFFVAAKAGTNHESHNHNDVGSFVLFQNGFPVLIDIGAGTYTAKTFGPHRYELFFLQSQYHNCPTINGVQQQAGAFFSSHNVTFKELTNNEGFIFSDDIAGAYPKESHTKHWIRSIELNRTANIIQVDDQYQLDKFVAPQKLHFITVESIEVEKNDHGLLLKQANVNVLMHFDWKVFECSVELKSLDKDHKLTQVWGDNVKRITLTTNEQYKQLSGHFTIRFSQSK